MAVVLSDGVFGVQITILLKTPGNKPIFEILLNSIFGIKQKLRAHKKFKLSRIRAEIIQCGLQNRRRKDVEPNIS